MGKLTDFGNHHGTDKANYHEFTEFYEDYFAKKSNPNILEIGVLDGASLKTYVDYFEKKATIVGVDVSQRVKGYSDYPMIKIVHGDILLSSTVEACKNAVEGGLYDIIIDDGGHTMEQQQKALASLWELLKPGGLFIVEDLHTSGMMEYNPEHAPTTLKVLEELNENRIPESKYISEAMLKKIDSEIDSLTISEKQWPQVHSQPPRSSITCVIVKAEPAIPAVSYNLAPTDEMQDYYSLFLDLTIAKSLYEALVVKDEPTYDAFTLEMKTFFDKAEAKSKWHVGVKQKDGIILKFTFEQFKKYYFDNKPKVEQVVELDPRAQ